MKLLSTPTLVVSLTIFNLVTPQPEDFIPPTYDASSPPKATTSSLIFWPFLGWVPTAVTGSSIGTTEVPKDTSSATIRLRQTTYTQPLASIPTATDGPLLPATVYAIDDCSLVRTGEPNTVCPSYPQTTAAGGSADAANYLFYTAWEGGAQVTYQGVATSLPGGREQTAHLGAYCVGALVTYEDLDTPSASLTRTSTTCVMSATTIVRNTVRTDVPAQTTSTTDLGTLDAMPGQGVMLKMIGSEGNVPKDTKDGHGEGSGDEGGAALVRASAGFCVAMLVGIVWVL